MFVQSAVVAFLLAELSGYLAEHYGEMSAEDANLLRAVVAALSGGGCAVVTTDPLGGAITVPIAIRYLSQSSLPPNIKRVLPMLQTIAATISMSVAGHHGSGHASLQPLPSSS